MEDDPTRPHKAYVATALTFVSAFIAFWVADAEPFTTKDAGQALLASLVAAGLTGGGTYQVRNPRRRVR